MTLANPDNDRLTELRQREMLREYVFTSRVPVVGGLIARCRAAWNSVATKWQARPVMEQQSAFNRALVDWLERPAGLAELDDLFAIADIATPNRYELSWLAGEACETTDDIMRAASSAPPARLLVTSFPASGPDMIGNLWIGDGDPVAAEHPRVDSPPNGLGDLTAALLLARLMAGHGGREALRSTTASVFEVLAKTAAQSADELTLEECAPCLADPAAEVSLRPLKLPEGAVR